MPRSELGSAGRIGRSETPNASHQKNKTRTYVKKGDQSIQTETLFAAGITVHQINFGIGAEHELPVVADLSAAKRDGTSYLYCRRSLPPWDRRIASWSRRRRDGRRGKRPSMTTPPQVVDRLQHVCSAGESRTEHQNKNGDKDPFHATTDLVLR